MEERTLKILDTFYPDRIHHNRRIANRANVDIKDVGYVTKELVKHGYLEEVVVPKTKGYEWGGKSYNHYRLTQKGKLLVYKRQARKANIRTTYSQLVAKGVDPIEAAVKAAELHPIVP